MYEQQGRGRHIGEDPRIFPGQFNYSAMNAPSFSRVEAFTFENTAQSRDFWSMRVSEMLFLSTNYRCPERTTLAQNIIDSTSRAGTPTIVVGLFRVGKSTLCSSLRQVLPEADFLRLSLGDTPLTSERFNRMLLEGYSSLFKGGNTNEMVYREGYRVSDGLENRLKLIGFIDDHCRYRKTSLTLVVDECTHSFHNFALKLGNSGPGADLSEVQRQTLALCGRDNIRPVFVCHPLPDLRRTVKHAFVDAKIKHIEPLSQESVAAISHELIRRFGAQLEDGASEKIFAFCGGRPFELRLLMAYCLWRRADSLSSSNTITVDEIENAQRAICDAPARPRMRDAFKTLAQACTREDTTVKNFWAYSGGSHYFDFNQASEHYQQVLRHNLNDREQKELFAALDGKPATSAKLRATGLTTKQGEVNGAYLAAALQDVRELFHQ